MIAQSSNFNCFLPLFPLSCIFRALRLAISLIRSKEKEEKKKPSKRLSSRGGRGGLISETIPGPAYLPRRKSERFARQLEVPIFLHMNPAFNFPGKSGRYSDYMSFQYFLISDSEFVFSSRSLLSGIFPPFFCVLALYFRLTPSWQLLLFLVPVCPFWSVVDATFLLFFHALLAAWCVHKQWMGTAEPGTSREYQRGFLITLRVFFKKIVIIRNAKSVSKGGSLITFLRENW